MLSIEVGFVRDTLTLVRIYLVYLWTYGIMDSKLVEDVLSGEALDWWLFE